ncbi:hypothetical protein DXT88_19435 [Herbaspirillum lusitanum]|nr:hypothetical protein [Herbaspirillum lusitanum]
MQDLSGEAIRIRAMPKFHFFEHVGPQLYPNNIRWSYRRKSDLCLRREAKHIKKHISNALI